MFPVGVSGLLAVNTDQVGGAYLVTAATDPVALKKPLWVQRVQNTGALLLPANGKRVSSIVSNQAQPALSNDSGGGLLLTWYDDQRGLPTEPRHLRAAHFTVGRWRCGTRAACPCAAP